MRRRGRPREDEEREAKGLTIGERRRERQMGAQQREHIARRELHLHVLSTAQSRRQRGGRGWLGRTARDIAREMPASWAAVQSEKEGGGGGCRGSGSPLRRGRHRGRHGMAFADLLACGWVENELHLVNRPHRLRERDEAGSG